MGVPADVGRAANPARVNLRLLDIGRAFLLIGALAFGGQGGLLALLNRDLVERRRWVTETDITEAFTYVQMLPGAVVVQVVAYLGWKLRCSAGVAIATTAFLLPSVLVMLGLAMSYHRLATLPGVSAALGGLTAAVVGLLAVGAAKQARKTITGAGGITLAAAVFGGSIFLQLNPAILIVSAGLIGVAGEIVKSLSSPDTNRPDGIHGRGSK
jgi:chromate transporter